MAHRAAVSGHGRFIGGGHLRVRGGGAAHRHLLPVAGAGYGRQCRDSVAGRHHPCPHGREPYPEGGAGSAGQGDAGGPSQRRVPGTHGAGGFRGLHPCVQGLCVGAGFSDLRLRWGVAGGGHGDLQPCGDDGSHAVS